MPRPKKVKLIKGEDRVRYYTDEYGRPRKEIVNTYYCGECGRRVKSATVQKPYKKVAYACDNEKEHKDGLTYLWPLKKVVIVRV